MKRILVFLVLFALTLSCWACSGEGGSGNGTQGEGDDCQHDWIVKSRSEPYGCYYSGSEVKMCTKCGDTETVVLPALPHDWCEWYIIEAASCTDKGVEERTCDECGDTEQRELPLEDHIPGGVIYKEGKYHNACRWCDKILDGEPSKDMSKEYNCDSAGFALYRYFIGFSDSYYAITDAYDIKVYEFHDGENCLLYSNGYFISRKNNVYYLKDAFGKEITSSEKLGVTGFAMIGNNQGNKNLLKDGYVLVFKQVESYNGTYYEAGVIGIDGNWIVPLSANNPLVKSGFDCSIGNFTCENTLISPLYYAGDGCICVKVNKSGYSFNHAFYNIKTNKMLYISSPNMDYMITEAEFTNGVSYDLYNDFLYEYHTDGTSRVYDTNPKDHYMGTRFALYVDESTKIAYILANGGLLASTGNFVMDFYENNIYLVDGAHIGGGKFLIMMKNEAGYYYYTILDKNGTFLFEPIKATGKSVMYKNGTTVECSQYGDAIIIDIDGKELFSAGTITLKNGIICAENYNELNKYYYLEDIINKIVE